MVDKNFANQLDALELEFKYVEHLIDILYQLPTDHPYQKQAFEELHTHRMEMRNAYDEIRTDLMARLFSK